MPDPPPPPDPPDFDPWPMIRVLEAMCVEARKLIAALSPPAPPPTEPEVPPVEVPAEENPR